MATTEQLRGLAASLARQHQIPFFSSQISAESGFNPGAASGAGAQGIAQIVPRWHPDAPSASDPEGQLRWAANYMAGLVRKYGNPQDALSVYNSGRPWAQGQGIGETRNYVQKILGDGGSVPKGSSAPAFSELPAATGTPAFQAMPLPARPTRSDFAPLMQMPDFSKAVLGSIGKSSDALTNSLIKTASAVPKASPLPSFESLPNLEAVPVADGTVGQVATGKGPMSFHVQGKTTPQIAKALDLASQYIGTPYRWGGAAPGGFDCSGLLQYVWGKAGVSIPRTTYEQIKAGTPVPKENLQPGDAVFFAGSDAKDGLPGHVGMYVGDGKFIEAPRTGLDVRVSDLSSRGDFAGARRFA